MTKTKKNRISQQYLIKIANEENIIFSTDTIYGLGGSAYSEKACSQIFKIKNRPKDNPLIIHVGSIKQLNEFAVLSKNDVILINRFWPGPLTLLLQLKREHPLTKIILTNNNKVAVRMPSFNLQLFNHSPLAAPSANISGYISPSRHNHVLPFSLNKKIDLFPIYTNKNRSIESTIFDSQENQILREGPIQQKDIEKALNQKTFLVSENQETIVPGMRYKHYSPNVKVISDLKETKGILYIIGKINVNVKGDKAIYLKKKFEKNFYLYLHKAEALAKKHNSYINIQYNKHINYSVLHKINKILKY